MGTDRSTHRVLPGVALDPRSRRAIIDLCEAAFAEDFGALFALFPGAVHVLAERGGVLVGHACWVARGLAVDHGRPLHTAYIEAVAVAPACQRQGIGGAVMRRVAREIAGFELGALSPTFPDFYARLGWVAWRGPLAIRAEAGLIDTPDEGVMIYRTPRTPSLDLDGLLTAEWRPGELW
jgi:aminoglycoside 2'-N-acetyltransferase I